MKNKTRVIAEEGKQELFIMREFDAPRDLVFRTFTEPELLAQWLISAEHNMRIDYWNYKSGGSYRFIMPGAEGKEVGLFGVIHEVLAPERIIRTFEYEGLPERGHLALEKLSFETLPENRTKLTTHFICESVEYRNGLINSGMEAHTSAGFNKLDGVLEKQQQAQN